MPDSFNMSDVMISYSRVDKAFVKRLEQALKTENMEVWVDWEDIAPTADWWSEIQAGIEAAHTFVFVISPASVRSDVCYREIEHAVKNNKRIVPVLRQEIIDPADRERMHPVLRSHNWIYFRESDHFRRAFLVLCATLQGDLSHKQFHTRLLVRSREWETRGRGNSLLLRGDDLREAETWLNRGYNKAPQPTEQQIDYIRASRASAVRFQRLVFVSLIAILVVVSGTALVAANQSQVALSEANLRATQERRAVDAALIASTAERKAANSVAEAATAQREAADSLIEASTAQARVLEAQTLEAEARQASGNSATEAAIAQQSALTATVLQGNAQQLADQAKAQQLQADSARQQAEGQAVQGQATAQAANTMAIAAVGTSDAAGIQVTLAKQTLDSAIAEIARSQEQAEAARVEADKTKVAAEQVRQDAEVIRSDASRFMTVAAVQVEEVRKTSEAAGIAVANSLATATAALSLAQEAEGRVAAAGTQAAEAGAVLDTTCQELSNLGGIASTLDNLLNAPVFQNTDNSDLAYIATTLGNLRDILLGGSGRASSMCG